MLRKVSEGPFLWDEKTIKASCYYKPRHRLFYYLISAFTIFFLEKPGHPVGTPFPGGFKVEKNAADFTALSVTVKKTSPSQSATSARTTAGLKSIVTKVNNENFKEVIFFIA
ncbi:hypothetical protein J2128_001226 [Methanomicrobium sp. W14]|nr:hypothetical protein [Methanomicrobium sp. W14]